MLILARFSYICYIYLGTILVQIEITVYFSRSLDKEGWSFYDNVQRKS